MPKKSTLNSIAVQAGRSAVFGFGASAGRDLWRSTKKGSGGILFLIIVLAAITLPFLGGRNLTWGYPVNAQWQATKGYIFGVILILIGAAISFGLSFLFVSILSDPQSRDASTNFALIIMTSVGLVGVSLLAGMAFGLVQKSGRKKIFAVSSRNKAFIKKLGLVETGEKEITHYDRDQNPLRFMERTAEAMVFMVVGKRNQRAYIKLTPEGKMVGYTGAIPINAPRKYKDA